MDHVADDVADLLAIGVGRDLDHRRHDGRLDRDRKHPLDLGDDPLGDDPGRRQTAGEPFAQDLGVGRHERRIGMEPGDERLEALGAVDGLELGQLRQQLLRAAHLVDHAQLVEVLVVLFDMQARR